MSQQSQRCPHCGLNQWRAPDGLCKRCRRSLDEVPEPSPRSTATGRGHTALYLLVAVACAAVFTAIVLANRIPVWLESRGTQVGQWTDQLALIEIDFPYGWRHLRLDRGDLPMVVETTETSLRSIRGSFILQPEETAECALVIRMESLGVTSAGPTRRQDVKREELDRRCHARIQQHIQELGGEYTPLLPPGDIQKVRHEWSEGTDSALFQLNRFKGERFDGRVDAPGRFSGLPVGPLHIVQLRFKYCNRQYTIDALMPEDRYGDLWPVVSGLLERATVWEVSL